MSEVNVSCQELVELVTDYLEGALTPEARARFEQHLSACPGCWHYVEQMRATVRLMGTLREDTLDARAKAALLEAFRQWKQG